MAKEIVKNPAPAQLAVADIGSFSLMQADIKQTVAVLRENLASGMSEFDLDRVTVPAGGGTVWSIPGLEGNVNSEIVSGVIIYYKDPRAYWRESFDESGGGTPPDCSSATGDFGIGDPGGACARCPLAAFGTARKGEKEGRGQACKQMRQLFMLTADSIIPLVVTAPPTSLKAIKNFMLRLAGKSLPYYAVTVELRLTGTKNKDGIKYSQIEPRVTGRLSEMQLKMVQEYRAAVVGNLNTVEVTAADAQAA